MCFEVTDKNIKRAGLDYWSLLDVTIWESLEEFLRIHNDFEKFYFATTKSDKPYFDAQFQKGDYLFFGGESTGLPMELMRQNWNNAITIPMGENGRSLNQSVAVGIVLYDAIRQNFKEF
jgi:tRNA (cytidine/uridine-2'-O-)-methyltransferase